MVSCLCLATLFLEMSSGHPAGVKGEGQLRLCQEAAESFSKAAFIITTDWTIVSSFQKGDWGSISFQAASAVGFSVESHMRNLLVGFFVVLAVSAEHAGHKISHPGVYGRFVNAFQCPAVQKIWVDRPFPLM